MDIIQRILMSYWSKQIILEIKSFKKIHKYTDMKTYMLGTHANAIHDNKDKYIQPKILDSKGY